MTRKANHRRRTPLVNQPTGRTIRMTENRRSVLDLLEEYGHLTRSQITTALPKRANGISQTLSDLRAFGYVEHHRKGCPQQHKWSITERGRDVVTGKQAVLLRAHLE